MAYNKLDYENYDYREFWQDDKRKYEDASERIALKKLMKGTEHLEEKIFVDLGCGFGRLISEYKDFGHIILIDYSLSNLQNAKRRISDYVDAKKIESIYFICADALNIPIKSSSIHFLISVRLIHHIKDISRYIAEISRILADSSTLVLEFANKKNLKNILRFFLGKSKQSPFDEKPLEVGDTILNWHPKTIMKYLDLNDFKITSKISVSNLRISILKRKLKLSLHLFLEKSAQFLFSFLLIGPSIFIKSLLQKEEYADIKDNKPFHIVDILICPKCKGLAVQIKGDSLTCASCSANYRLIDGIFDLRV